MFHVLRFTLYFLLLILLLTYPVFADIKLNEILIEPDPQSIEIINTSSDEVDISSWYLDDSGGSTYYTIPQDTIIYPGSCLVFSSNFNLNKASSDTIRIFNNTYPPTSTLSASIDFFSYTKSPGDSISFIRIPDAHGDWATAPSSLNYFNSINESCLYTLPTSPISPTLIPTTTLTPTPNVDIKNIYISEVMIAPNTGENEWVELYNDNAYEVNLIDWFIDDVAEAGSTQKKFSISIPSYGFAVIELSQSILNNSSDVVRLIKPSDEEVDSFNYDFSEKGITFGRVDFNKNDFCLQTPSYGKINNKCIEEEPIDTNNNEIFQSNSPNTTTTNQSITKKIDVQNYIELPSYDTTSVLGSSNISFKTNAKNNNTTNRFVSFLSSIYSLLTVISISLKMKK